MIMGTKIAKNKSFYSISSHSNSYVKETYLTYKKLGLLNNLVLSAEQERSLITSYKTNSDINKKKSIETEIIKYYFKYGFYISLKHTYKVQKINLLEDFISESSRGILSALKNFDHKKFSKIRFSTYAKFWIKKYLYEYSSNNHSIIKFLTSKNDYKIFNKITKTLLELKIFKNTNDLNFEEISLISKKLKVTPEEIQKNIACSNLNNIESFVDLKDENNEIENLEFKIDINKNLSKKEKKIKYYLFEKDFSLEKTANLLNSNRETLRLEKNNLIKKIANSII